MSYSVVSQGNVSWIRPRKFTSKYLLIERVVLWTSFLSVSLPSRPSFRNSRLQSVLSPLLPYSRSRTLGPVVGSDRCVEVREYRQTCTPLIKTKLTKNLTNTPNLHKLLEDSDPYATTWIVYSRTEVSRISFYSISTIWSTPTEEYLVWRTHQGRADLTPTPVRWLNSVTL